MSGAIKKAVSEHKKLVAGGGAGLVVVGAVFQMFIAPLQSENSQLRTRLARAEDRVAAGEKELAVIEQRLIFVEQRMYEGK